MGRRISSKDIMRERADAFTHTYHEFMVGTRRMGIPSLLDTVAEAILRSDPDANILKLDSAEMTADNIIDDICKIAGGKELHVILYGDASVIWDEVILSMPNNIHLYRGQELCHQVPVCIKYAMENNK